VALRRVPGGNPGGEEVNIHILAWDSVSGFGSEQHFLFSAHDLQGVQLFSREIQPPKPANGFIIYPAGLTWDARSDSFFYLERNTATIVRLSPAGETLAEFPHPAPAKQSFVYTLGLASADPLPGLLATSAGPEDKSITRLVHFTPSGLKTGLEVPLSASRLNNITGIWSEGHRVLVLGTAFGYSQVVEVELTDPLAAPQDLECRFEGDRVVLEWRNPEAYDAIDLFRDGRFAAAIPGALERLEEPTSAWPGPRVYALRGRRGLDEGEWTFCEIRARGSGERFIRGDVDRDFRVAINDPILLLQHLFLGGVEVTCADAGDANDNGALQLVDAIVILTWMFIDPNPLPEPFPQPGIDPTPDRLDCK
jgi:hypothetical protein